MNCKDHLGQEFVSVSAMCRHWNIPTSTFHNRMNSPNYTLEQALTLPPDNHRNAGDKCLDHLGHPFKSKREMCEYWHIPRAVFFGRIRLGWSLEKALTAPLDYKAGAEKVYDHLGQAFDSEVEMCKAWNIGRGTFRERKRRGWDIEKCLTAPTKNVHLKPVACVDHKGNKFPSKAAMYRHYGISKYLLGDRLARGWSLQDALETTEAIDPHKPCVDHLGQEFPSVTEMLKHWNVGEVTYRERIRRGNTLEQALSPENHIYKPCTDHLGNEFPSVGELCQAYQISASTLWSRQNKGWSQKACLETPVPKNRYAVGTTIGAFVVQGHIFDKIGGFYYKCTTKDNFLDLLTHQELQKMETNS